MPFLLSCCAILAAALVWQARRHAGLRKEWRAEVENIGQEHANTERALEAHRDAMLNALSDPLFLVDSDGVIRFANVSAGELFRGRTLLNRRLREVFLDERLSAPILDAIAGQSRLTLDVILPRQASPLGSEDHRGETAWVVDAAPITSMPSENNLTCVTLRD
ncbi:MAG: PAS domain-containing protein, partial [Akkermansiaceae bacterium]|nr:PAS domain-containing protein [Akkermansiaceae bacterium]